MSEIDLHKHKPIATILGYPLYLAQESFIYQKTHQVTPEDVIWRDDSSSVPVIINIRFCIAFTFWLENLNDSSILDLKANWSEIADVEKVNWDPYWREDFSYLQAHEVMNEYNKVIPEKDRGSLECFVLETISLILINNHFDLLTEKEQKEAKALNLIKKNFKFPQGSQPYSL